MIKINGVEINAKNYFFDGCHKFYFIEGEKAKEHFFNNNWEESDIFPIEQLDKDFWNSCSLRFIDSYNGDTDTFKSVIPQCEKVVTFEINGHEIVEDFENDILTVDGQVKSAA